LLFPGKMNHQHYNVLGLMSGTSLDGLDIACCEFSKESGYWKFTIPCAETIPYDEVSKMRLTALETDTAIGLVEGHIEYGHYLGRTVNDFIRRHNLTPGFISSHGHTVFHRPGNGITFQAGCGAAIAAETGLPVVCDFRSSDVALGGQGAPLVPIGDALLFGEYDYCLNIGGFSNISQESGGRRIAWDICPSNIVLNQLARRTGMDFDPGGTIAASGKVVYALLEQLNALPFYATPPPKSLGKEWVNENILPVISRGSWRTEDLLATFCEHIAMMIARNTGTDKGHRMLVTGGGAFNDWLISRISNYSAVQVVIPDPLTVNFKEALIFAFLGVLRMRGEVNSLRSVTGARMDSVTGAIYIT
jgi:anhydro-N-acetylmuramic acid kinase